MQRNFFSFIILRSVIYARSRREIAIQFWVKSHTSVKRFYINFDSDADFVVQKLLMWRSLPTAKQNVRKKADTVKLSDILLMRHREISHKA